MSLPPMVAETETCWPIGRPRMALLGMEKR